MADLDFSFANTVLSQINLNTGPWALPPIYCNTELSSLDKKTCHPQIIQSAFKQLVEKLPKSTMIYTDASKNKNTSVVGAAVVTPTKTTTYTLPAVSSVYTGELFAIYQALLYIANEPRNANYIISTDSLSSLQSIQQIYTNNGLVRLIQEMLHQIHRLNITVLLIYTPSHVGIKGNEKADKAAYTAAITPDVEEIHIHLHGDIINYLRQILGDRRQTKWTSSGTRLQKIKPKLSKRLTLPKNRSDQIKITRLRLGYTHITHEYILAKQEKPKCDMCQTDLTVEHILIRCPKYNSEREKYKIGPTEKALGDDLSDLKTTIDFLKDINIYNKI